MNKFKLLRIKYPGIFAIKENIWISFFERNERFAFFVGEISKGLTIHDPNNKIINADQNYKLENSIEGPKGPFIKITPMGSNMKISFTNYTEEDPSNARTYSEKPYTELFLLLDGQTKAITIESVLPYLNSLFIRYNSSQLNSTLLKPDKNYWDESLTVLECMFEHETSFENIIKEGFDWNLPFKPVTTFLSLSKYGILPKLSDYINNESQLPEIPHKYLDVFELLSSGIMQLNYFKNYKLALLECFVAVEVAVVRITNEILEEEGISKTKISEFKQAIDLAYRMDVLLRLFFSFNKKEDEFVNKMGRARSIRNNIMHNNKIADEEEIKILINEIREFLWMLINKHVEQ